MTNTDVAIHDDPNKPATDVVRNIDTTRAPYLQELPNDERSVVEEMIAEIDFDDASSILKYTSNLHGKSTAVAGEILEGAKNRDLGSVGALLQDIVLEARKLDTGKIRNAQEANKLQETVWRVFRRLDPFIRFVHGFEAVNSQIETKLSTLLDHRVKMLREIQQSQTLYKAAKEEFRTIELRICGLYELLRRLNEEILPELKHEVEHNPNDFMLQEKLDARAAQRDEIKDRIKDLEAVRSAMKSALPKIRHHAEEKKKVEAKINTLRDSGLVMWKLGISSALLSNNTMKAAEGVNSGIEFTNDMIRKEADLFHEAMTTARKASTRSLVDPKAIDHANQKFVKTIRELIEIDTEADRAWHEGRKLIEESERKRRDAVMDLIDRGESKQIPKAIADQAL